MAVKRDVLRVRMLVFACLLRTSKSGRARGVEWAEAVDTGAFYSDAQQKPSGSGQCEKNCAYKTLYLLLLSADMISHFVISSCLFGLAAHKWLHDDLCRTRRLHSGRVHHCRVSRFFPLLLVTIEAQTQYMIVHVYVYSIKNANVLHFRNKKEEDPTVFTKTSTKLEASACRLQLPEVRNAFTWPDCSLLHQSKTILR